MLRSLWPFTLRGTAVVVAGAACVAIGSAVAAPAFTFIGLALVLLTVLCLGSLWLRPVTTSVSRLVDDDIVPRGTEVRVRLRVEVGRAMASAMRWSDPVRGIRRSPQGSLTADDTGTARLTYTFTAGTRGEITLGALMITAVDVCGLARRRQTWGPRTALRVGPAVVELATTDLLSPGGAGGRPIAAFAGHGTDDLVPRPYMHGDSRRRVHWKATAHRGELMVRQEEQESAPTATVVLDRVAAVGPGFEDMLSAAVSAAAELQRGGYSVDVLDTDGTIIAAGVTTDLSPVLDALALMAPVTGDPTVRPSMGDGPVGPTVIVCGDRAIRVTHDLQELTHRGRVIAVLSLADSATATSLQRAGWRTGDLRRGVAAAWNEATDGDR